jgi:hypothetical protein
MVGQFTAAAALAVGEVGKVWVAIVIVGVDMEGGDNRDSVKFPTARPPSRGVMTLC